WFITFNFINITWIFFRAKDFESAMKVLKGMSLGDFVVSTQFANVINYFNPLVDYFKLIGVKYTGFANIYILEMIIFSFVLVLCFKNSMERMVRFKPNYKIVLISIFCLFFSSYFIFKIFTSNKVSEFLYFNF
ncbi:MBOAT family protein, partial [Aliarcobacter butzleri]|nr:MBOAT family protein [Arcobacter sp. DNRA7]MCR1816454.1 MBOAT family protein [Aliarcobacter butzleri]